jgi:uncharacterized protein (TIGR03643 family)
MTEQPLTDLEKDRVIEMAWEDRTTFDAILLQFGLKEQEVIDLMRNEMKPKSFIMWRKRVQGRKQNTKKLRGFKEGRFKCNRCMKRRNNENAQRH